MKNCVRFFCRGSILAILVLVASQSVNAEVIWNLKLGGWMRSEYEYYYYSDVLPEYSSKQTNIFWTAGLELDIPFNEKWGLTTGLRYAARHTKEWDKYDEDWRINDAVDHLELPLRLTYNYKLKNKVSLQLGVGPFASWNIADDEYYIGLEPAVSLYLWNFNIGLSYNTAMFMNSSACKFRDGLMVTMGIRFNSSVWGSIGKGVVVFDEAMRSSGMYDAINSYSSGSGTYNSSSSYDSGNSSYKARSSSATSKSSEGHSVSEMNARNTDNRTYGSYETQLSKMRYGNDSYNESRKKDIQRQMKRIREKWEKRGLGWSISPMETW